jgi:polysaccharide export outer membrane protein
MYFSGDTNLNLYLEHGDVITIPDRQSRKVFLLGELGASAGSNNARSYVMRRGRMSLSEVIADAGGPNPFSSNAGEVFLMRQGERGQALIYQLDVSQVDALILAEQIAVRPKDIVYVSPTTATRIGRIIIQFFPVLQGQATARSGGL